MTKPIVLTTVLLLACVQAHAADAQRGRRLYMANLCYTCHGTVGQGGERGSGPKIAPGPIAPEAFALQVRRPRQAMPRYPVEFLDDQGLADIHAYLASIPAGPDPKTIPLLSGLGSSK